MISTITAKGIIEPFMPTFRMYYDKNRDYYLEVIWLDFCCNAIVHDPTDKRNLRYMAARSVLELSKEIAKNDDKVMEWLEGLK